MSLTCKFRRVLGQLAAGIRGGIALTWALTWTDDLTRIVVSGLRSLAGATAHGLEHLFAAVGLSRMELSFFRSKSNHWQRSHTLSDSVTVSPGEVPPFSVPSVMRVRVG